MATTTQAKKTVVKKTSAKKATDQVSVKNIENTVNKTIGDVREEATVIFGKVKGNFSKARNNYKRSWLAGLGLIGRSADELQARYETMTEERQKLVKELVARGEQVQDDASNRIKESRATLEEKLEEAKSHVSELPTFKNVPSMIKGVSDRLEALSKNIKKAA
jgi:hypothetical protein